MSRLPLIGIPADRRLCGKHYFHMVGEKYIEAVAIGANALPVLVPALGSELDLRILLDACDGLLLTGSASNVEPQHYGGPASAPGTLHDPNRDATTLPLIPRAVAAGVPVLAICRGFQEMNVAYGGTLNQRLHEVRATSITARMNPRRSTCSTGPRTRCCWSLGEPCGKSPAWIACRSIRCIGRASRHWAADLAVEARAPDGVIEAFRVANAPSFALGLQWHPEWQFERNPFSRALFAAFGEASRRRAARSR